jgi:hypothetical protein
VSKNRFGQRRNCTGGFANRNGCFLQERIVFMGMCGRCLHATWESNPTTNRTLLIYTARTIAFLAKIFFSLRGRRDLFFGGNFAIF